MAVRRPRLRSEARHDHVRPESADHADDVGKDGLAVPDLQGLAIVLREPEVVGTSEVLAPAIHLAGLEQLFRAGHAQLLAELGAEQVLAAVAPGEREIGRAIAASAG